MDNPKQHVIDTLKEANNILVTVKNGPTIDQLAACIALTLVINELGKHGTAVFSGQVPAALDFLEPDKTIEKNTDSLQDFIISLDKAKADKLRYKIEDTVVKIFITPYRTSLSPADLNFEPGDFNVDVVVALGIHNQDDVDTAITEHGRILHDATVLSVNNQGGPSQDLGSIAWIDENASSLSEMISEIANDLGKEDAIDNQVATALLTGIVAETERFGNNKVTPETMQVASRLLTAGANQELVSAKLSEPEPLPEPMPQAADEQQLDGLPQMEAAADDATNDDGGALQIEHTDEPVSPFAQENADFEIPQPEGQSEGQPENHEENHDSGDGQDQPANADIIDLNQLNGMDAQPEAGPPLEGQPEAQGEQQPSFPQPPLEAEGTAANSEPVQTTDSGSALEADPWKEEQADQLSSVLAEANQALESNESDRQPDAASGTEAQQPLHDEAAEAEERRRQEEERQRQEQERLRAEEAQRKQAEAVAEQAEEKAALDYLKDRQVDTHPRAFVEPLKRRAVEPLHRQEELNDSHDMTGVENSAYSFEPPTLGGTLTANLPNERAASSLDKQAADHQAHAPILHHGHSAPRQLIDTTPAAPRRDDRVPQPAEATPTDATDSLLPTLEPLPAGASSGAVVGDLSSESSESEEAPQAQEQFVDSLPQAPTPTLTQLEQQVQAQQAVAAPDADGAATSQDDSGQTASLITPLAQAPSAAQAPIQFPTRPLPAPVAGSTPPPPAPPPVQAAMR